MFPFYCFSIGDRVVLLLNILSTYTYRHLFRLRKIGLTKTNSKDKRCYTVLYIRVSSLNHLGFFIRILASVVNEFLINGFLHLHLKSKVPECYVPFIFSFGSGFYLLNRRILTLSFVDIEVRFPSGIYWVKRLLVFFLIERV